VTDQRRDGYKLYCFDKLGDRLPAVPVEAINDADAIAFVRKLSHNPCELWQGGRLVLMVPERRATA